VLALDVGRGPLRPAILYGVDTRATAQIAALEASRSGRSRRVVRMDLSSRATGPKIAWHASASRGPAAARSS
jgi:xylulokinase